MKTTQSSTKGGRNSGTGTFSGAADGGTWTCAREGAVDDDRCVCDAAGGVTWLMPVEVPLASPKLSPKPDAKRAMTRVIYKLMSSPEG